MCIYLRLNGHILGLKQWTSIFSLLLSIVGYGVCWQTKDLQHCPTKSFWSHSRCRSWSILEIQSWGEYRAISGTDLLDLVNKMQCFVLGDMMR